MENVFEEPDGTAPPPPETPEPVLERRTPERTLVTAMLVVVGVAGIYGGLLLAAPRFVWVTIGGAAELHGPAYDGTRFVGGLLVGLAIAALFVLRSPSTQNTLVTVMAIQATAAAAGDLLTVLGDDAATAWWFEWGVAIVTSGLALYLWWARFRARRLLANP